jgi:anti-sigma B factor antagonist
MDRLGITVGSRAACTVIHVVGDLDMQTAPQLDEAMEQARTPGIPLVVDLSRVGFIDTYGLRSLLLANADGGLWCAPLRIVASPAVEQTIRLAGADQVLSVYSDQEHALAGPAASPVHQAPSPPDRSA